MTQLRVLQGGKIALQAWPSPARRGSKSCLQQDFLPLPPHSRGPAVGIGLLPNPVFLAFASSTFITLLTLGYEASPSKTGRPCC